MINMIWAMDEDFLIGKDDQIPWHIKEDLLYYKSKTKGQTVLMGEATYYSLKGYYKTKPLPYGKIYVASINLDLKLDDAVVINDVDSFLKNINEDIWVVGGATIYKLSLPYADRLYISFIKGKHEGNKYFPHIDFSNYKLIWEEESELVRYTLFERV
ncbi:MAG: dihydrofolate reductase [Anaeroplasma sp.]|nr:dihydrofolate reductase [Anaeroplasma sp.]